MLKFKEEKKTGLLGLTTCFVEVGPQGQAYDAEAPFAIIADAGGIRFVGNSPRIADAVDLDTLAKTVSLAWTAHRHCRPKVLSSTGH